MVAYCSGHGHSHAQLDLVFLKDSGKKVLIEVGLRTRTMFWYMFLAYALLILATFFLSCCCTYTDDDDYAGLPSDESSVESDVNDTDSSPSDPGSSGNNFGS